VSPKYDPEYKWGGYPGVDRKGSDGPPVIVQSGSDFEFMRESQEGKIELVEQSSESDDSVREAITLDDLESMTESQEGK